VKVWLDHSILVLKKKDVWIRLCLEIPNMAL
jgi:hypothetical protein